MGELGMKWAFYNILFLVVYPFLLPGFLVRMLRRGGGASGPETSGQKKNPERCCIRSSW